LRQPANDLFGKSRVGLDGNESNSFASGKEVAGRIRTRSAAKGQAKAFATEGTAEGANGAENLENVFGMKVRDLLSKDGKQTRGGRGGSDWGEMISVSS